ncbi:lipid IV(A) 3-deoxy-D-manno-octulosonic acid transferase [Salinibius halmophilus]|uniref:lipid IV(A) 3-deoxy-D-manno-octulosonic acid transferase n=1 Tax=Salinibius halmophilus TaxID=1853216 RepID=UPI000E672C9A|nr:lipid IV(A) 3-deoxy-D-manno-octulosonic acid transferase [Salinibius halmophilus]
MLTIYRIIWWLATPFLYQRLHKKAQNQPAYLDRISERRGEIPAIAQPVIWFHTVSVGESLAAINMIKLVAKAFPTTDILVTAMTPTGSQVIQDKLGDDVIHYYLPWDRRKYIKRFLASVQPQMLVLMETEIWPELITQVSAKQVPIVLANARMSQRSGARYLKLASFSQSIFKQISLVCAQSSDDAQRFSALGATNVQITGTVKYDVQLQKQTKALAEAWQTELGERFIWLAASTHPGEEASLLAAHKALLAVHPNALLILAPRHPDRRAAVSELVQQAGLTYQLRSQTMVRNEQVWLLDSLGEMIAAMGCSDLVFMGGSLIEHGGHNPLEAGVWPKAVVTGPHYFNFQQVVDQLVSEQAIKVVDAADVAKEIIALASDSTARSALAAQLSQVLARNRGSTQKQAEQICRLINERP